MKVVFMKIHSDVICSNKMVLFTRMRSMRCTEYLVTGFKFKSIIERLLNLLTNVKNLKEFHINYKMTRRNPQCKSTYLQVILQASGKYFPEISCFPENSSLTHENIEVLHGAILGSYIKIPQLSRSS